MIRVIAFLVLTFCALMMPVWVFGLLALGYVFFYGPYELLVLAVLIDARFGEIGRIFPYVYTALVAVIVCIVAVVRPRLRI